jgi:AmmeMemoRadiSam system protein B
MHSNTSIQGPAVAGLFYPEDPQRLAQEVDAMLQAAAPIDQPDPLQDTRINALIVPHAGYIYSGSVAASAYILLKPIAQQIRRVLLIGPAHRLAFSGIVWSKAHAFRTPLGDIPQDKDWQRAIATLPFAHHLEQAFTKEHCLEVQLPFLQRLLDTFSLLNILVGQATPSQVAQVIDLALNDPTAMIIITTDLSHYHSYSQAQALDAITNRHILDLNYQALGQDHACGRLPVSGLLMTAKAQGWHPRLLNLRNSGDSMNALAHGNKDSVVGYAAYVLT